MLAKNTYLDSEWLNLNEELGVDKFQTILIQNKSSGSLYVWPRDTLPDSVTSGIYIKTGQYITINGGGESVHAKGSGEVYFQAVDPTTTSNITLLSRNINLNEVWLDLNQELGVDKNQTLFVQNKSRGSLYLWPRDSIPDSPTAGTQLRVGDYITINGGGESVQVRGVGEIYVSVFLSSGSGTGSNGAPGEPGASAYQIAVANGFSGTESQWLLSLVGPMGPTGPPGPPGSGSGSGDLNYTHNQGLASSVWTITHNLGKRPTVTIQDSANDQIEGNVFYNDLNTLTISFSAAFSGFAYLN